MTAVTSAKSILIYGSTEFGKVVRELVEACGYAFAGFIDDWHASAAVIGTFETVRVRHPPKDCVVALAIGYKHMQARQEVAERLFNAGYQLPPLVHPQAYVAPSASIDDGVMVMARATVDVRVHLGSLTVVWPGAIINHDCDLSGNTFVSPGVTVCGHCRIGDGSFLGAGSIVIDHVELPKATFVKAGEVCNGARTTAHAAS